MKNKNQFRKIITGIFFLLGLHIIVLIILGTLAYLLRGLNTALASYIIFSFFYIGLLQLLYVIPTMAWLKRTQQPNKMKGVIIGAVITALLNLGYLVLWLFSFG